MPPEPDASGPQRGPGRPPKLWAAFEIGFFRDPRVRRLSTDAKLLFLAGRAYASEQGTDGLIDKDAVQLIAADAKVHPGGAALLVLTGLWDELDGGYQDVDFLRTNKSAESRERRWQQERDRKASQSARPEFPHGIPHGNGRGPEVISARNSEFPHVRAEQSIAKQRRDRDRALSRSEERDEEPNDSAHLPVRADVEQVCALMAELVSERTGRRPTVRATWRRDARLLLERDRQPIETVERVMRWAASDPFWRSNVLGIPAFRKQFDRLKLKAEQPAVVGPSRKAAEVSSHLAHMAARVHELEREEQA